MFADVTQRCGRVEMEKLEAAPRQNHVIKRHEQTSVWLAATNNNVGVLFACIRTGQR